MACLNAWPSPRQLVLDGWLLRASGGAVRRANSVNPLPGCRGDLRAMLPLAEAVYGALGQTPLVRLPSLIDGADALLEATGYTAEGRTLTLFADLQGPARATGSSAVLTANPNTDWLAARARLSAVAVEEQAIFRTMLDHLLLPRAFAAVRDEGQVAAIAYAVLCDGLAVVEAVVTDPAQRRRGLGRQVVGGLLDWAAEAGAEGACLQVVADNVPALALYRSLGFTRELSRYHYRRKAQAAPAS